MLIMLRMLPNFRQSTVSTKKGRVLDNPDFTFRASGGILCDFH